MTEVKTELKIRAKSEGVANLRNEVGQLNRELRQGAKEAQRGFDEAEHSLGDFTRAIRSLQRDVGKAFGGVAKDLQSVVQQLVNLQQQTSRVQASFARGGFVQGLAQGAGVGEFIQRGPGMGRQIAGRFVGRALAGGPRTVAGGLFGGVSGFAQGLASIPGGGLAAAPIMNAIQMAERALEMQRAQFQALPTLGGVGLARRVGAARANPRALEIGQQAALAAFERPVGQEDITARLRVASGIQHPVLEAARASFSMPHETALRKQRQEAMAAWNRRIAGGVQRERDAAEREIRGERAREASITATRQARERAARGAREQFYRPLFRAGRQLGAMDPDQSMQFATQLAQAAGTLDPRSMMRTAAAAQTAFGVSPQAAGMFLRAERRGGLAGAGGEAGLVQALAEGQRLGLQGSELTQWMQEVAEGISNFEQTGIPINPRSIGSMARAVSILGVGATRGQRIAGGLFTAGQRLAQQGPSTAMDILMLQQAGFRGGGTESLLDAMVALEQGLTGPQATAMMEALVRAGGGGAGGVFTLHRGLAGMGVNIGLGEAQSIAEEIRSGRPGAAERVQAIMQEQKRGGETAVTTPQQLQRMAKTMVDDFGPQLRRQASLTEQQINAGKNLLTSVQNLQQATTTMTTTVAENLGPAILTATGFIQDLSKDIRDLITTLRQRGLGGTIGAEIAGALGIGD